MEFGVLGVVEVRHDDSPVELGGRKQRLLLLSLLVEPGVSRTADQLAENLWADQAPGAPGASIRAYLHNLRKIVEPKRAPGAKPAILVRRGDGYALAIDPTQVDAGAFERDVELARQAATAEETLALVRGALARWRGAAFTEARDLPFCRVAAARLEALRSDAEELFTRALLDLDRAGEAVAVLESMLESDPYRETAVARLAQAHYRTGRQADALRTIDRARRTLRNDLGVDIGPELRALEVQVLNQDPALEGPSPGPTTDGVPARDLTAARPQLAGRAVELAALNAAAARLGRSAPGNEGGGDIILIAGPAGIGKTRLVEEFAGPSAAQGANVVWVHCDAGARRLPLWPWGAALRDVLDGRTAEEGENLLGTDASALAPFVPGLREEVPGEVDAPTRFRAFDAVARVLRRLATEAPLILVVEDAHWADDASVELLAFLAPRLRSISLLVVVTTRDEGLANVRLQELRALSEVDTYALEPLTVAELRSLVERAVGPEHDLDRLADVLHERSGGNTLFAVQMLRAVDADDPLGSLSSADVGRTISEVVARRLSGLPDGTAELLTVASTAGAAWGLDVVATVADVERHRALDLAETAITAGLIEEVPDRIGHFRFTHAVVGESIEAALTGLRRAHLHVAVGAELERQRPVDDPIVAAELAWHYCAGAPAGSALAAVPWALEAAQHALDRFDPRSADEILQLALDALEYEAGAEDVTQARVRLLLVKFDAAVRRQNVAVAHETALAAFELAQSIDDVAAMARAAILYSGNAVTYTGNNGFGSWLMYWTDYAVAADVLESALAHPDVDSLSPTLHVSLLSALADARHEGFADGVADRTSAEAVRRARQIGEARPLIETLAVRHLSCQFTMSTLDRLAIGEEIVELATTSGLLLHELHGRRIVLAETLDLGDRVRADQELDAIVEMGHRSDHELVVFQSYWLPLAIDLARGRLDRAEEGLNEGFGIFANLEESRLDVLGLLMTQLFRERYRYDELQPSLEARLVAQPNSAWRASLLLLHTEYGHDDEAEQLLATMPTSDFTEIEECSLQYLTPCLLADAVANRGDEKRAIQLISLLEPHADQLVNFLLGMQYHGWVDHYLGRLKTVIGAYSEARAHLDRAVARAEGIGAEVARQRGLLALAERELRERGEAGSDRSSTLDELAAIAATARRSGLEAVARRADDLAAGRA